MNEQIKMKMEQALNEPSAPETLIARTIRRCQSVTAGRIAEQRLEKEGDSLRVEERRVLAAEGLLGRMAQRAELPRELTCEKLVKNPAFCRMVDRPAAEILAGLRQGSFLREIVAARSKTVHPLEKKGVENSGPIKK